MTANVEDHISKKSLASYQCTLELCHGFRGAARCMRLLAAVIKTIPIVRCSNQIWICKAATNSSRGRLYARWHSHGPGGC